MDIKFDLYGVWAERCLVLGPGLVNKEPSLGLPCHSAFWAIFCEEQGLILFIQHSLFVITLANFRFHCLGLQHIFLAITGLNIRTIV